MVYLRRFVKVSGLLSLTLFSLNALASTTPIAATNAVGQTAVMYSICAAYTAFAGPVGKILAVLCLIGIGIGFFMAKVTWTTALTVVLGLGAIFGSIPLVQFLTGGTEEICPNRPANTSLLTMGTATPQTGS